MESAWQWVFSFVTLLLFPLLGILGLLKSRASPVLASALLIWLVVGVVALARDWHPGLTRTEFVHGWLIGAGLGLCFLAVDRLRRKRKISRLLKLCLATLSVIVFVQALRDFLQRHA